MYDLTERESFENLPEWLEEITANSDPDVTIYLVGNQHDLEAEERQVSTSEGHEFMGDNKLKGFREASAKTGHHVETIFEELTAKLLEANPDSTNKGTTEYPNQQIRRNTTPKEVKKGCSC